MTIFFEIALVIIIGMFMWFLIKTMDSRTYMINHYWNHVTAYRVGLIKKRAAEREIELCFPDPEDKLVEKIEKIVEEDLDRVP